MIAILHLPLVVLSMRNPEASRLAWTTAFSVRKKVATCLIAIFNEQTPHLRHDHGQHPSSLRDCQSKVFLVETGHASCSAWRII